MANLVGASSHTLKGPGFDSPVRAHNIPRFVGLIPGGPIDISLSLWLLAQLHAARVSLGKLPNLRRHDGGLHLVTLINK